MQLFKRNDTAIILKPMVLNMFLKRLIENNIINENVHRIQAYKSIMCEYFSIGFIDFMLHNESLTD